MIDPDTLDGAVTAQAHNEGAARTEVTASALEAASIFLEHLVMDGDGQSARIDLSKSGEAVRAFRSAGVATNHRSLWYALYYAHEVVSEAASSERAIADSLRATAEELAS